MFSLFRSNVRRVAVAVARLSHDDCRQSEFLLRVSSPPGLFLCKVASVTSHVRELLTRVKGGAFQTSKVRGGCLSNPDHSPTANHQT